MACALVSPCGHVEIVGNHHSSFNVTDVLQEPIISLAVRGFTLFYSTAAYFSGEVNEFASGLAQQLIKGDACLVHSKEQKLLDCLQHSKQLRIVKCEAPASNSSNARSSECHFRPMSPGAQNNHPKAAAGCEIPTPATTTNSCSSTTNSSSSSSPCLLKRPRSLQHIAAANSARNRILRSMSAVGPPAADPSITQQPQRMCDSSNSSRPSINSSSSSSSRKPPLGISSSSSSRRMPGCIISCSVGSGVDPPALTGSASDQVTGTSDIAAAAGQHSRVSAAAATAAGGTALAAAAGGACALPAACAAVPVWSELPVEVIAAAARFLGDTVAAVMPLCMTCRSWRRAVLDDDQLLLGLSFRLRGGPPRPNISSGQGVRRAWQQQHPLLLERASKLGNVSALVVRARLLDAAGCPDEAMRCWRRAAKAGHLEGQLLYGLALYRGSAGVAQDPEDAHMWLSKALKQVLATKQPANSSDGSSDSSGSSDGSGSSNTEDGSGTPLTADILNNLADAAASNSSGTPSSSGSGASGSGASSSGMPRGIPSSSSSSSSSLPSPVPFSCQAVAAASSPSSSCGRVCSSSTTTTTTRSLEARVLSQAGLVLGYLSFDGEGTRTDRQEAVRCFKLAAQAGCREAQQVLGWMFNTGQY